MLRMSWTAAAFGHSGFDGYQSVTMPWSLYHLDPDRFCQNKFIWYDAKSVTDFKMWSKKVTAPGRGELSCGPYWILTFESGPRSEAGEWVVLFFCKILRFWKTNWLRSIDFEIVRLTWLKSSNGRRMAKRGQHFQLTFAKECLPKDFGIYLEF